MFDVCLDIGYVKEIYLNYVSFMSANKPVWKH